MSGRCWSRRASSCSTANPASCWASASPAPRALPAASAGARWAPGASRRSSSSSRRRSTRPSSSNRPWPACARESGSPCCTIRRSAQTVEGEPVEIFPFLGCSRLEEPLNRYPVTAVVHGHAHNGALEGRTDRGVPVYNVSAPLLRKSFADRPPFRLIEVEMEREAAANVAALPADG